MLAFEWAWSAPNGNPMTTALAVMPTADQQPAGYVINDGAGARVWVGEHPLAPDSAPAPNPDPDPAPGPMAGNTAAVAGQDKKRRTKHGKERN
ncbi:unnamed protein product [Clonostachys byssicola]|uniref:Uncharacterized protein n=1 Tax=Clonostachys byssicola TaxID=160290 RepID=A0A9N9UB06_9HYPO|nr:unnamed protein product [Clonostachys byssicola]